MDFDLNARWMRDSLMNSYLSDVYGWHHSQNPTLYFSEYHPRCNLSLCGYQEYKLNLASKAVVREVVQKQNITFMVPESFNLDVHQDLEKFERKIPCKGKNVDWILKRGTEEFGRGLEIPKNYSDMRARYLVPYENWCHPHYQNKSYDAVSIEVEDKIWENRRRVVAQQLIVPYTYQNMSHANLRYYLVSFYPSKKHFLYTIPHWTFNPIMFDPSDIESVLYTKYKHWHYILHKDVEIQVDFNAVILLITKLFQKVDISSTPDAEKTKVWELTSIDFLIDHNGQLRFLLDVTQGPVIVREMLPDFWPEFFELFFDLHKFPTHRDFCSTHFIKLKTHRKRRHRRGVRRETLNDTRNLDRNTTQMTSDSTTFHPRLVEQLAQKNSSRKFLPNEKTIPRVVGHKVGKAKRTKQRKIMMRNSQHTNQKKTRASKLLESKHLP